MSDQKKKPMGPPDPVTPPPIKRIEAMRKAIVWMVATRSMLIKTDLFSAAHAVADLFCNGDGIAPAAWTVNEGRTAAWAMFALQTLLVEHKLMYAQPVAMACVIPKNWPTILSMWKDAKARYTRIVAHPFDKASPAVEGIALKARAYDILLTRMK